MKVLGLVTFLRFPKCHRMVADASDNFHVVKKKLRTIFMGVEPFKELLFAAGELHQAVQKTTDGLFYRLQIIECPFFQDRQQARPYLPELH